MQIEQFYKFFETIRLEAIGIATRVEAIARNKEKVDWTTGPTALVFVSDRFPGSLDILKRTWSKRLSQHSVSLVAPLLLVVRPGAPSSVLAPSSDALCS